MEIKEYSDCYAIELHRNVKQRQQVDTDKGISIEFGFRNNKPKLTAILFDKSLYTPEDIYDWRIDHEIRFIPTKRTNIKIPEIDFWLDPIFNNYIVCCYRTPCSEIFSNVLKEKEKDH